MTALSLRPTATSRVLPTSRARSLVMCLEFNGARSPDTWCARPVSIRKRTSRSSISPSACRFPAGFGGSVDATLRLEPVGSVAVASGQAKRAVTNPVAQVIADPFYSGVSLLTLKFLKEQPQVAKKVVEVIDAATKLANANFDKYKPIIPKYTPIRPDQLNLLAKPYLRGFAELNDTDLNSYQALVDAFQKEGVLQSRIDVRDKILRTADFGS